MTDSITELTLRAAAQLYTDRPLRPPFDPELAPAARAMSAGMPRAMDIGAPALRALFTSVLPPDVADPDLTLGGRVAVARHLATGPDGDPPVALIVQTPTTGDGPWPLIYHVHGGGMIMGTATLGIGDVAPYVAEGLAVVASVEYRLAPEHPDPAPIEDCYAGLRWIADHAEELGVDPDRVTVYGDSAGGGLAAGLAILARDRGRPAISHQVLLSPMLDDRMITPSSRMLAGDGPWDRLDNLWAWTALLGERRGGSDVSRYAAPARATDLAGLPRTYIDCGSTETFRDEILDYAGRLSAAGVVVDLHMWGGGFHGFDHVPSALSVASKTARDLFLRRALA